MGRNSRKDNDVSAHAVKAYTGSSIIAPLIPNFGTKWKWVRKDMENKKSAGRGKAVR